MSSRNEVLWETGLKKYVSCSSFCDNVSERNIISLETQKIWSKGALTFLEFANIDSNNNQARSEAVKRGSRNFAVIAFFI